MKTADFIGLKTKNKFCMTIEQSIFVAGLE